MQKILIIVAVTVFAFAILFSKKFPQTNIENEVLSSSTEENREEITSTPSPTSIPTPTTEQVVTIKEDKVVNNTQGDSLDVRFYLYASSRIVSTNDKSIIYESSESTDNITNWLKQRIKESGMNVTSFVSTKTNGSVNNSLVGASNGSKVSITVNSEPNSGTTTVKVNLEN